MHNCVYLLVLVLLAGPGCASSVSDKDRATARLRHDLGVASLEQGDLRAALKELLGAVESDPTLAEAHNALGLTYHKLGKGEDALRHYDEAVRLKPGYSEAHNNRGVLLIALGRYDEAIAAFEKALADVLYATPQYAEAHLGWAYFKKGDVEQSLRHLRNAVATDPKFCLGYTWLAEISLAQNQGDQVVAYCKRFQKQCVDDAALAPTLSADVLNRMELMLGQGYLSLGMRDEARAAFTACAKVSDSEVGVKCAQLLGRMD
jgi:type IV pilus biogenesis/stability protein PilW